MKKVFFVMLLMAVMIAGSPSRCISQTTIGCCCNVWCYYQEWERNYKYAINDCTQVPIIMEWMCDATFKCIFDSPFPSAVFKSFVGECNIDPCAVKTVLGGNDARIDTLRSFRDGQLAKSAVGKKLRDLYSTYSFPLVTAFIENPSLQEHAKELLEKLIPRVRASMRGRLKGSVLDAELYAEAEMLLDEISLVLSSPLKKDLMSLKDEAREAGLVE